MLELWSGRSESITSLLRALVQMDGERLVMHADDAPYVFTPGERIALTSRLTPLAVYRIVRELVPAGIFRAFEEIGCVFYQFAPFTDRPDLQFTIIASQHENDLRVEIHRARGRAAVHRTGRLAAGPL
jgi:hypothetical protein